MRILGVLVLALTLGLGACGGSGDNGGDNAQSSVEKCKSHKWGEYTTVKNATCTEDGSQERVCTVCGEKQTKTIKAAHTWGEWAKISDSTCAVAGKDQRECSVCHKTEQRDRELLEHTFEQEDGKDKITWSREATCTLGGIGTKHCTVCKQDIETTSDPLGHLYEQEDGKDKVNWTRQASCEVGGVGTKTCIRPNCGHVEQVESDPTGHKWVTTGGTKTPAQGPGFADFYEIPCANGCGKTSLGFMANEPTLESKDHLVIDDDGGARFWGRPIGNALALDKDGTSVNQSNNEIVYCKSETGDFFEYKFDLTAAQAQTLSTCRCYCDAKPADHLSGDFWAYNRSNTDWTPGYYIDGSDEHVQHNEDGSVMMVKDHARPVKDENGAEAEGVELETEVKMGARIEDYRYILYVDDQPQDFDPEISVPVQGSSTNMKRAEYVMPFTFHLHKGTNIIRLHMAGGYRSVFYAFYFRQYVAPTPIVVNESTLNVAEGKTAQITSDMTDLIFVSSDPNVASVDQTGLVTGVKAGTATITVSKEGNYKDAKVTVNVVEKEGTIALNLTDGVIAPEGGVNVYNSSSSGTWYNTFKKDATVTYTFQSTLAGEFDIKLGLRGSGIDIPTNIGIKVNGVDVTLTGTVDTSYSAVEYVVGKATLKVGENTLVITALQDSSLYLKTLKLIPTA